jgi:chemotaxis protein MotB
MSAAGKTRAPKEPPPQVIIKKVRAHGGGHHGGAWKVAYADFVTTMMALFIVLWAAGQDTKVRQAIASYFRNPTGVPNGQSGGVLPASAGVVGQAGAPERPSQGGDDPDALYGAANQIREKIENDTDLRGLREQVQMKVTPEGLRIELVERDGSLFFEVGSAQVKPAMTQLLSVITSVLRPLPNELTVEGHTDVRQYSRERVGYGNWELSSDRANSARRVLEAAGLPAPRIRRVIGFAEHDLLLPDRPLDAQNRRVSIVVATRNATDAAAVTKAMTSQAPADVVTR